MSWQEHCKLEDVERLTDDTLIELTADGYDSETRSMACELLDIRKKGVTGRRLRVQNWKWTKALKVTGAELSELVQELMSARIALEGIRRAMEIAPKNG